MGRRGPPATPTAILELRGSWRAAARKKLEPKAESGRPDKPSWLSPAAAEAWDEVLADLEQLKVLTTVDGRTLVRYCTLWVRWREAEEALTMGNTMSVPILAGKKKKKVVVGQRIVVRPEVRIADSLSAQLLRIEQEFGLTPAARARLAVKVEEGKKKRGEDKSRFINIG